MKQEYWRVHVPRLLVEICNNPQCSSLVTPLRIMRSKLAEVAQRIVGYKDKLDALVTEALIPMSDPPTVEATREWRDSQKTAIQPEVEDVKIEHSTRVITRRQETIRL